MKIIILDGYNVIHKIPEIELNLEKSLLAARVALAAYMSNWRNNHPGVKVYIVFDGRKDAEQGSSLIKIGGIDCIFTHTKREADDHIIDMVRNTKKPSEITVVSDDNKVRNNCRAHGVDVKYSIFLQKSKRKHNNKVSQGRETAVKNISTEKKEELTDYYKVYLRNKGII